jgi:outer membrane protein assembly factor BamD
MLMAMKRSFSARLFALSAIACLAATLTVSAPAQLMHHAKKPKKASSTDPLAGVSSKQPDKELFDKAMTALKKGKYDVARLDLQALLTTYPESEYQMRAKLAVGDSWYKEGGAAALQQAEAEYKDFITFFPNQPEAAEAQMKVGDIYYQQMEKPDRDPTNAQRSEQEYRLMIQQYPDSTLVPRAKQRLREVQEVLAQRQFTVGSFYATHENWPASIARLQTLTDSYPLYSKSDMALLQLGDNYAAEANVASKMGYIKPAERERLVAAYEDRAADCYSKVVTRYPMAPHVEDARERLIALGRPVPEPTQTELAESEAEEQSRANIKLKDRAILLVKHGPSTIEATRVGEPLMTPAKTITAPEISKENIAIFNTAAGIKPAASGSTPSPDVANGTAAPRTGDAAVPNPGGGAAGGTSLGVEVLNPNGNAVDNSNGNSSTGAAPPAAAPPASESTGAPAPAPAGAADNYGLKAVGPANTAPLPPVEKPAQAQTQVNDVKGGASGNAQVETGTPAPGKKHKKNPKVKTDQSAESSSTNKKKKGLDKLNPF